MKVRGLQDANSEGINKHYWIPAGTQLSFQGSDIGNCPYSFFNVFFRIEWSNAQANGPVNISGPETLVHHRGTLQAGPAGYVVINIQYSTHIS